MEAKEKNIEQTAAAPEAMAAPPRKGARDVISARHPELNMDDDGAVGDYLGDHYSRYDKMKKGQDELNDVLSSDPRAAGMLVGLSTGNGEDGEPFSLTGYLLENYWDDITGAASSKEAVESAKKREAAKMKEAADEAKRKETRESNLKKTDEALSAAMTAANVDEATASKMLYWLYGSDDEDGFVHKIIMNDLNQQDWERLLHAYNMDNERERFRTEGMSEGRKQRPGAMHRSLAAKAPTDLGAGGGEMPRGSEEDPTLAALNRMKPKYS